MAIPQIRDKKQTPKLKRPFFENAKKMPSKRKKNATFLKSERNLKHPKAQSNKRNKQHEKN